MADVTAIRSGRWIVIGGGSAGLAVWLWDHDFLLNAGGPATPISDALLRVLHVTNLEYPLSIILPLLVLIGAGLAIGAGVSRLVTRPQ
jgi:hypothetical protein